MKVKSKKEKYFTADLCINGELALISQIYDSWMSPLKWKRTKGEAIEAFYNRLKEEDEKARSNVMDSIINYVEVSRKLNKVEKIVEKQKTRKDKKRK